MAQEDGGWFVYGGGVSVPTNAYYCIYDRQHANWDLAFESERFQDFSRGTWEAPFTVSVNPKPIMYNPCICESSFTLTYMHFSFSLTFYHWEITSKDINVKVCLESLSFPM